MWGIYNVWIGWCKLNVHEHCVCPDGVKVKVMKVSGNELVNLHNFYSSQQATLNRVHKMLAKFAAIRNEPFPDDVSSVTLSSKQLHRIEFFHLQRVTSKNKA